MSTYIAVPKEDVYDIEHHGIIGQKWGIRRYQNKDGSLTPEGKARYGTVENFNKVMKTIKTGTVVGGPVGGMIARAIVNKKYSNGEKHTKVSSPKKINTASDTKQLTKKESPKQGKAKSSWDGAFKSEYAKKLTTKDAIDKEVTRARKEGTYDMEFLEQNLDVDDRTGESLTGAALDKAYRRYLSM